RPDRARAGDRAVEAEQGREGSPGEPQAGLAREPEGKGLFVKRTVTMLLFGLIGVGFGLAFFYAASVVGWALGISGAMLLALLYVPSLSARAVIRRRRG